MSSGGILEDVVGDDSFGDPDAEPHQIRLPYLIPGIVKNRKDPLGLGRITLTVEGLFEDGTDWLTPLTGSGGIKQRGFFNPPRLNAVACAFFPMGLVGPGFYIAGGWAQKTQVPSGALVDGDHTRAVFEDDQWLITLDDRGGKGEVTVKHKTGGQYITVGEAGDITLHVKATKTGSLQEGATQPVVLGTALDTYLKAVVTAFNAHTHTGGTIMGLTGTPTPTLSNPVGILSSIWKVK